MNVRRRSSRRELRGLLHAAARRPVPAVAITPFVPAAREETAGIAWAGAPTTTVTTRRELQVLLRAAGSRPVPRATPALLDQVEARFGAEAPAAAATESPVLPRRSRVRSAVLAAAAAAAALALVAGLTGVFGGPGSETGLALSVAVDTLVTLPDGTTVDGARGLVLPEGAVVRTGPQGRAVAGGSELGPGVEAVVRAGRLQVVGDVVEATPAEPLAPGVAGPTPSLLPLPGPETAPAGQGGSAPAPPAEAENPPPPPAPALPSSPIPTLPALEVPDVSVPDGLPLP